MSINDAMRNPAQNISSGFMYTNARAETTIENYLPINESKPDLCMTHWQAVQNVKQTTFILMEETRLFTYICLVTEQIRL